MRAQHAPSGLRFSMIALVSLVVFGSSGALAAEP